MRCNSAHFQARRSATIKLTDQRVLGAAAADAAFGRGHACRISLSFSIRSLSSHALVCARRFISSKFAHLGLVLRAKGMSAVLAPHASNSRSAEALLAVLSWSS